LPNQGFDGIAVSLLGGNSPWGVFSAAIFFGLLHSGKGFMNAMTKVPPEIADTIIATIIYFSATSGLIERYWEKAKKKFDARKDQSLPHVADPDGGLQEKAGGVK
jgi:simple sugar transport system permease protein